MNSPTDNDGIQVLADACDVAESIANAGAKEPAALSAVQQKPPKSTKRKMYFADFTNVDEAQRHKKRETKVSKRFVWGELSVFVSSSLDHVKVNFGTKIEAKLRGKVEYFADILMRAAQATQEVAEKARHDNETIKIKYRYQTLLVCVDSNIDAIKIVFDDRFSCKITVLTAQHLAEMLCEAAETKKSFDK